MFRLLLGIGVAIALSACASTHPGNVAKPVLGNDKVPLKVSGQVITEGSSDAFQMVEITLENSSDAWVKVANSKVTINDPNPAQLSVVLGDDLKSWAEASAAQQQLDKHNRELLQAGILTAGLVVAIIGGGKGDMGAAAAGSAVVAGTYTWVLADAIKASIRKSEGVDAVPENHIYHSVSVPSKMFLRRWVLINKKPGFKMQKLALEVETVEGEKEDYVINL